MLAALGEVEAAAGRAPVLVYLDCDATTLLRRYSETRRRHPHEPERLADGRHRARDGAAGTAPRPGRRADRHPRDDPARPARRDGPPVRRGRGARRARGDAAVVLLQARRAARRRHGDRRAVPEEPALGPRAAVPRRPRPGGAGLRRGRSGLRAVLRAAGRTLRFLLPAYRAEGKSYFGLGLGCTGGKHRSVVLVEALAKTLAADGWQVSIRHRDLEQARGDVASGLGVGIA